MSTSVLVSTFAPFPTLTLSAPSDTPFATLYDLLAERYPALPNAPCDLVLSPLSGRIPEPDTPLWALHGAGTDDATTLLSLRLLPRLRGGKGGFGSQLRAAGGRMSSQKTSNNDSCRDLSGRRLSTIKEAKKLAEYIESEPERKKAQREAQRAKLEELERKLGIVPGSSSSEPLAGKKHRLDDTEYVEQSREIVDSVKSAVSVAMLKKKKKAKLNPSPPPASTAVSSASAAVSSAAKKVLEAATTAPAIAAATSAAVGVASA